MASMTYDEFDLGSKIFGSGTVTEAHIVNAAGIFNDFNPLHVNEEAASNLSSVNESRTVRSSSG